MIRTFKDVLLQSLSAKLIATVLSILGITAMGILYWGFDSAYLAAFGIGPEIYNRPFFSSRLMNVWLFVTLIKPITTILISTCITISFFVTVAHLKPSRKELVEEEKFEKKWTHHVGEFLERLIKNLLPTLAIIMIFLTTLSMTTILISLVTTEAKALAQKQIDAYFNRGECIDAFDNTHLGCYKLEALDLEENLVILNDSKTIIFLNRDISTGEKGVPKGKLSIHVFDKAAREVISRKFVIAEPVK